MPTTALTYFIPILHWTINILDFLFYMYDRLFTHIYQHNSTFEICLWNENYATCQVNIWGKDMQLFLVLFFHLCNSLVYALISWTTESFDIRRRHLEWCFKNAFWIFGGRSKNDSAIIFEVFKISWIPNQPRLGQI